MTSLSDLPSHLAEPSNTILTLVVALSGRKIGKCGKYQPGFESPMDTSFKYPLLM